MTLKDRLKVKIEKTTTDNQGIISAYWEIDEYGNIVNRPSDIKEVYNVTIPEIRKLVKELSNVTFDKGTCSCGNRMIVELTSQQSLNSEMQEFKKYDFVNLLKCDKCIQKEEEILRQKYEEELKKENELYEERFNEATLRLEKALEEERWKSLDEDDFDALLVIARSTTKGQVINILFEDKPRGTLENKLVWQRINRLENLGLIWVKRDDRGSIIEFYMLDNLRRSLNVHSSGDDKSMQQDFYEVDDDEIIIEDTFRFVLRPNGNVLSTRHPNYSGKIKLDRNILLEKGKEYRYGGWINDDGSIYLKITPADEPFVDAKESKGTKNTKEDVSFSDFRGFDFDNDALF